MPALREESDVNLINNNLWKLRKKTVWKAGVFRFAADVPDEQICAALGIQPDQIRNDDTLGLPVMFDCKPETIADWQHYWNGYPTSERS